MHLQLALANFRVSAPSSPGIVVITGELLHVSEISLSNTCFIFSMNVMSEKMISCIAAFMSTLLPSVRLALLSLVAVCCSTA